ncbi:MAG: ABC transporter permease [Paraglaciecola chathamensis]|uniref:Iron ABC transporter permease n=2 Tax=Paraglaciecola chathamensis TaxID=368405 RepID=A0ABS0WIT3_9ALTE|nr:MULTISPECIES: iron ABC transporter permease [Paraglaciecola]AEE23672.1 binding-protein-dependent transport systems inner membrane component [Glaciecola sp. 4H-3-7+YE-5]MBJ2138345.1 iron ABC transporter permease [Paraglaciecola chathamensis]GAC03647.1 iron(III) transport system permease protein [Paraglaciecola agarilytica NO2]
MKISPWREPWLWAVTVFSLLLAVPVLLIFTSVFIPQKELWQHLFATVLNDYVYHSLLIAFSVGGLTLLLGTSLAWLVARYEFAGRGTLQWLILLPMAMPAYILAYTYTGMLDVAGPLQTHLRATFNWTYHDYWFPDVRSVGGAILMLSLVLYPYVYMLARTAFSEQSASFYEASRSMGVSGFGYFRKVAFPLARPAILTGTALAMMEAFADYGTVQYFGISTFTTGIFRTWNGLGNAIGAAQLAAVLTSFVLVLLLIEKHSRRRLRYFHQGQKQNSAKRLTLTPVSAVWAVIACLLPVSLGFIIPCAQLLIWAAERATTQIDSGFIDLIWNSFYLAASAALIAVGLALLFAYAKRLRSHWLLNSQVQIASLGYAIPGTVIAIGAMLMLSAADDALNALTESLFDTSVGLIFSGTLVALLLAYSVRFLAVALHNVEAGLQRIKPSMDDAARSMGLSSFAVLKTVHIPLLRASVLSAILLVFVDVLKELPATLILRPFNFNTLAVRTFELASEERLQDAAVPAIAIVLVGILPVVLLTRALESGKDR